MSVVSLKKKSMNMVIGKQNNLERCTETVNNAILSAE